RRRTAFARRDSRSDERQSVPLRRLREHRRGDRAGGRLARSRRRTRYRRRAIRHGSAHAKRSPRMNRFSYARATDVNDALAQHRGAPHAAFVAGGTNLVDLIRVNVEHPERLIDITRLPLRSIDPTPDGGLRIGALVTNSAAARDRTIVERYPLLSKAILAG